MTGAAGQTTFHAMQVRIAHFDVLRIHTHNARQADEGGRQIIKTMRSGHEILGVNWYSDASTVALDRTA